jgi:hypothetical protein
MRRRRSMFDVNIQKEKVKYENQNERQGRNHRHLIVRRPQSNVCLRPEGQKPSQGWHSAFRELANQVGSGAHSRGLTRRYVRLFDQAHACASQHSMPQATNRASESFSLKSPEQSQTTICIA